MPNYFKVWWGNVQVGEEFPTKEQAEYYIKSMRITDWEIVEFDEDMQVVNHWLS